MMAHAEAERPLIAASKERGPVLSPAYADAAAFAPRLDQVHHRREAEKTIQVVYEARDKIEQELRSIKKKMAFLDAFKKKILELDVHKKKSETAFKKELDAMAGFVGVLASPSPYEALAAMSTERQWSSWEEYEPGFLDAQRLFFKTERIKGAIWKREHYQKRIARAQRMARDIARREIGGILSLLERDVYEETKIIGERSIGSDLDGCLSSTPETFPAAARKFQTLFRSFQSTLNAREFETVKEQCSALKTSDPDHFGWLSDSVVHALAHRTDIVGGQSERLQEQAERFSLAGYGGERVKKIAQEMTDTVPKRENGWWEITKELYSAAADYRLSVDKAERLFGKKLSLFDRFAQQTHEAKSISEFGGILTHVAPPETMEDILTRGDLSSFSEQKQKHGSGRRTHRHLEDEWLGETHEVCFLPRTVYRAGISWEDGTGSHVALGFFENTVLHNRQYTEMDGIHVFDENFRGEHEGSPGLSLDLRTTPHFYIVTERKREWFLAFLKEKSFWKDSLAALDDVAFQQWVNGHVCFVSALQNFCATPELSRKMQKSLGVHFSKGYVELSDAKAKLQVGPRALKRFVPFGS
ncbi:MAG: hypothetical protein Q7R83_01260 [bacterium]|nr:hypothetical protein [bacterium]